MFDARVATVTVGRGSSASRGTHRCEFHEWHGSDGPQYGNVASLEAAKQAFRAAWDRRPTNKERDR